MKRLGVIVLLIVWGLVFPDLPVKAQTRFERQVAEDFWHLSRNINGIREIPVYSERRSLSFAEIRAGGESRGLFGASIQGGTLIHMKKTSLLGTGSFREGCGSTEDMARRTCALSFGATTSLSNHWSLGGKMNFKQKDCLPDFSLEPSLLFRNHNWRTGISLILRNQSVFVSSGETGAVFLYGAAVQASLMEAYSGEIAYIRSPGMAGAEAIPGTSFPENRLRIFLEYRLGGAVTQWIRLRYDGLYRVDREDRIGVFYKAVTPWNAGLDAHFSCSFGPSPFPDVTAGEGFLDSGLSLWRWFGGWRLTAGFRAMTARTGMRFSLRRDLRKGMYLEADGSFLERVRFRYPDGNTRLYGGLRFGIEF